MKSKNKKRVALYIRTSSDESVENIDVQKNELKKYCETNGYVWNDKHVYEDIGYSGATDDRPELKRLLQDSKKGEFEIVLAYKIYRLARNLRILLNTIEALNKLGVAFRSTTEPFDTSSPFGKSTINVIGVFAEMERDINKNLSKRKRCCCEKT